MEDKKST